MAAKSTRARGVAWALAAAVTSGVAIYLNAYGVRAIGDATVYTTAKNLVAAIVLAGAACSGSVLRRFAAGRPAGRAGGAAEAACPPGRRRVTPMQLAGLAVIGVVGGSVPFILFFEGLAQTSATNAAFVQKTLLVWVAILAVPLLRERLGPAHLVAIALLMAGQLIAAGGAAGFQFGTGEWLVLAATLLWAVEVIVAKPLLRGLAPVTVGVARMGLGAALLIGWVALTGKLTGLTGLTSAAWGWVLLTGLVLACYVGTWLTALALAPAVDVTAVLVAGAIITAALSAASNGGPVPASELIGLGLLAAGTGLITVAPKVRRLANIAS